VQQKLPAQLEAKVRRFLDDVRAHRMQHEFDSSLIINMDEAPMCFDMPSSTTIDVRGKKEILSWHWCTQAMLHYYPVLHSFGSNAYAVCNMQSKN
jgi:hypothetical protein